MHSARRYFSSGIGVFVYALHCPTCVLPVRSRYIRSPPLAIRTPCTLHLAPRSQASSLKPQASSLKPQASSLKPQASSLQRFRKFVRHAWLLHGYLIASLILLPCAQTSSHADEPPPEDPPPAEAPGDSPPEDPSSNQDSGISNQESPDSDSDGIPDSEESALGSDPYNPDSDYDGISDADELQITGSDPLSPDSNHNGVSDYNEFYGNYTVTSDYNDPDNTTSPVDYDGDGIEDPLDPDPYSPTNDGDQDFDYVPDSQDSDPLDPYVWNDWNHNGINDDVEPTPDPPSGDPPPENPDRDGDGVQNESDSHPDDWTLFNDWNWNGVNDQDEDWDGDGVSNLQDSHPSSNMLWCDWNQNGINDDMEAGLMDSDGDGHQDSNDSHTHNASLWCDWNQDGTNDDQDPDPPSDPPEFDGDGDGYPDYADSHPGDHSRYDDWNHNGIPDGQEIPEDTDGDGTPDSSDSDPGDSALQDDWNRNGINDSAEGTTTVEDSDGDGVNDNTDTHPEDNTLWNDQNANGINDEHEVILTDGDNDGYADHIDSHPSNASLWNDHNHNGINDEQETPPDADNDGIPDSQDAWPHDFDNDGIPDLEEINNGTNPGTPDSDGDGLTDAEEAYAGTNPNHVDTDSDGLTDFEELRAYHTNPTQPTTIVATQAEAETINQSTPPPPTNAPSASSTASTSVIALSAFKGHFANLTAASIADSDNDGIPDGVEDMYAPLMSKDNPADAQGDLDGDGVKNIVEFQRGTDLLGRNDTSDTDGDGITNVKEDIYSTTQAPARDAQGNLLKDAQGKQIYITVPGALNRYRAADATQDFDHDGLLNIEEVNHTNHLSTVLLTRTTNKVPTITYSATDPQKVRSRMDVYGLNSFIYNGVALYAGGSPTDRQLRNALTEAHRRSADTFPSSGSRTRIIAYLTAALAADTATKLATAKTKYLALNAEDRTSMHGCFAMGAWLEPASHRMGDVDTDSMPDAWEHTWRLNFRNPDNAGPLDRPMAKFVYPYTKPPEPGPEPLPPAETDPDYPAKLTTYQSAHKAWQIKVNTLADWHGRTLQDPDGDRVSNLAEYYNNTNPKVRDYNIPVHQAAHPEAHFQFSHYYASPAPNINEGNQGLFYPEVSTSNHEQITGSGLLFQAPLQIHVQVRARHQLAIALAAHITHAHIKVTPIAVNGRQLGLTAWGFNEYVRFQPIAAPIALVVKAPVNNNSNAQQIDSYYLNVTATVMGTSATTIAGPFQVTHPNYAPAGTGDNFNNPADDYTLQTRLMGIHTIPAGGVTDIGHPSEYTPYVRNTSTRTGHYNLHTILGASAVKSVIEGTRRPPDDYAEIFGLGTLTGNKKGTPAYGFAHTHQQWINGQANFIYGAWEVVWTECPAFNVAQVTNRYITRKYLAIAPNHTPGATGPRVLGIATFTIDCWDIASVEGNSVTGYKWVSKASFQPANTYSNWTHYLYITNDHRLALAPALLEAPSPHKPTSENSVSLLPIEVVTPREGATSEGYSGDLVTATNLKVAKMELSLDENHRLKLDKDPDRFFVRIPGGARLGGGSVTISTENPDSNYDDNATRLKLVVDGNDLRSSSLILVADEKDDVYPGGTGVGVDDTDDNEDRTHLVQLGGTLKLKTLILGGQAHSIDLSVPVKPKKRLTATVLYLGAAKDSKNQLARSLKIVSERYAQVGIEINLIEHDLPVPPGVDPDAIQSDAVGNVVPSDVKAIFDSVPNEFRNEVMIIVAPDIRVGVGIAYTLRGGGSNGTDAAYRNKGVVSARKIVQNQRLYTIAHELGHILTNHYHFGQDYPTTTTGPVYEDSDHRVVHNLIRGGGTSADEEISASKRLYQMQENMFQNNLLKEVD